MVNERSLKFNDDEDEKVRPNDKCSTMNGRFENFIKFLVTSWSDSTGVHTVNRLVAKN